MAAACFKVVRVVRWRDLHRASAEFTIHHLIADDRNLAIHQRHDRAASDQVLVAFVFGMHGDRGVAQHRLRPRRRDHEKFLAAGHRILDVPKVSLTLFVQHFQIAEHGETHRAPVRHALVAINQPLFVQAHKYFAHNARQLR